MWSVNNETCREYLARRLAEGWRFEASQGGSSGMLTSPDGGARRYLDLGRDVETLRPSAAGDETGILNQSPVSGSHYDKMDEASSDGDSTYVTSNNVNAWERDLYNLPSPTGSGIINKVTVYVVARNINSVYVDRTSVKVAIKTGGTVYEGANEMMTTSYQTFSHEWATNPATSQAWTWENIEALQVGLALRRAHSVYGSATRGTQVYLEVDYSSATPKTATDSGSGAEARASGHPLISLVGSDTGGAVDGCPAPLAAHASSESGGGAEALLQLLRKLSAESGRASEVSHREVMAGAKNSFDSGVGVESRDALGAALIRDEPGSGMETPGARLVSSREMGMGAEASDLLAALVGPETGSAIDTTQGRRLMTGEATSALEKLASREIAGTESASAIECGGLGKMLLASDGGTGIETIASLLLSSVERGGDSERHGPRTAAHPGTSALRLYPNKGRAGLPSKEVKHEPYRNDCPGETGPEGRSHSLPLGG